MKIRNKYTSAVIFSDDSESMKQCVVAAVKANINLTDVNLFGVDLTDANLTGANLTGANLFGANLTGANLTGADLFDTIGNMEQVKSLQLETWMITYTDTMLQIGCQRHTIEEWFAFDDDTIADMDSGALEFWTKWKDTLKQIITMSPGEAS